MVQVRPGTPSTTPTPHRVNPGSTPSTRTRPPPGSPAVRLFDTLPAGSGRTTPRHGRRYGGRMRVIGAAGRFQAPTGDDPNVYVEHLRVPDLSVGTYSVPAGGRDDQIPHTEDEIYLVTAGRGRIDGDGG